MYLPICPPVLVPILLVSGTTRTEDARPLAVWGGWLSGAAASSTVSGGMLVAVRTWSGVVQLSVLSGDVDRGVCVCFVRRLHARLVAFVRTTLAAALILFPSRACRGIGRDSLPDLQDSMRVGQSYDFACLYSHLSSLVPSTWPRSSCGS